MSDRQPAFAGSCLCGAVRYEAEGEAVLSGNCYCLVCQKTGGAGHVFHVGVRADRFRALGATRVFTYTADSGAAVALHFCPTCGTHLFAINAATPDTVDVRAGTLSHSSSLMPREEIFTRRRQPWDRELPDVPKYAGMPPMGDAPTRP